MITDTLSYYSTHKFALFPCRRGTKTPLLKWKEGSTTDSAAWAAWAGDNLAVDCAKSGLIVIDVDASKVTPQEAWQAYHDICISWGLPAAPAPMTQSARGGWHVPFRRPADIAASDLRGGGTLVKISDIRPLAAGEKDGEVIGFKNRGYCVAAGSWLGDLPYLQMPDAPAPHECPMALLDTIRLPIVERTVPQGSAGLSEPTDVARLVAFLDSHGEFDSEPEWFAALGAIKLACGDTEDALLVARQITHEDATEEALLSRWSRLADTPNAKPGVRMYTIASMIKRAKELGAAFRVGKSAKAMFDGVAAIAHAAGATLPEGSLFSRGATQCEVGEPILQEFLSLTTDAPFRPSRADVPTLPSDFSEHPLTPLLVQTIDRMIAMAELPKGFRPSRVVDALAVLSMVHKDTADAVIRRIRGEGASVPEAKVKLLASNLSDKVERSFIQQDEWVYDGRSGLPERDNSDNVAVGLGILSLELRWNLWLERAEIRGGVPGSEIYCSDWTYLDDNIIARIRTRWNRTKTRFCPGKEFLWDSLLALAHSNVIDPALDHLAALESAWDRVPRLGTWLSHACHMPCDTYTQAVGRNIIGGLVRRIREPGCKHDTMPVFFGPQGPGKSTMAAIIADMGQSTLAEIISRSGNWFTDTVLLGAESKELVLALSGIAVAEIGEMGMQSSANASLIKAMVSRQIDSGRTAYARSVTSRPRRNIFIGTVNGNEPLSDPTGNRRFLPVNVEREIDLEWLSSNIAALIGEAAVLHSAGADFAIPRDVWETATKHQEDARARTPVEELCQEWFDRPAGYYITATDIGRALKMAGQSQYARYSAYLDKMGWRAENLIIPGASRNCRVWVNAATNQLGQCVRLEPVQAGGMANARVEMRLRQSAERA